MRTGGYVRKSRVHATSPVQDLLYQVPGTRQFVLFCLLPLGGGTAGGDRGPGTGERYAEAGVVRLPVVPLVSCSVFRLPSGADSCASTMTKGLCLVLAAHVLLTWGLCTSQETLESLSWPWHRRHESNSTSNACQSRESCADCSLASSWCHWCDHDETCHAIGSLYGCLRGSSCNEHKNNTPVDPSGCTAHPNCTACAEASHLCHWCAHDNACHAIGSVYGCVSGVDCYSNDRCFRKEPEPLGDDYEIADTVGFYPLMIIVTLCCCCMCGASSCFCIASGVKGAYDDLHDITHSIPTLGEPLIQTHEDDRATEAEENATGDELETQDNAPSDSSDVLEAGEVELPDSGESLEADPGHATPVESLPLLLPRRSMRPQRSRHMQRLFNMCTVCYVFTMIAVGALCVGAIALFPRRPIYNICNDAVAWKSIIDSLASLKPSADFQILGSLSNPNHFDVALDLGHGTFYHDGAFVGTFDIPPFEAKAMSISDFMIIAHLKPEKWEALSLTAEYYRGKLVLTVDTSVTVRIPALGDYSFSADVKGLPVNVNELSDRSLCACPTWSQPGESSRYLPDVDFTVTS